MTERNVDAPNPGVGNTEGILPLAEEFSLHQRHPFPGGGSGGRTYSGVNATPFIHGVPVNQSLCKDEEESECVGNTTSRVLGMVNVCICKVCHMILQDGICWSRYVVAAGVSVHKCTVMGVGSRVHSIDKAPREAFYIVIFRVVNAIKYLRGILKHSIRCDGLDLLYPNSLKKYFYETSEVIYGDIVASKGEGTAHNYVGNKSCNHRMRVAENKQRKIDYMAMLGRQK